MQETVRLRLFSALQIVAVGLLVLWWIALGVLLPVAEAATHFETMILHSNWVPVNVVGLIGCLLLILTVPVLHCHIQEKRSTLGFAGLIVAEIGLVMFTCIQYYETFLWPVVAQTNPELVSFDGPLVFGAPLVLVPLILSGIFLGAGYILLGIALYIERAVPRYAAILLIAGAVLFGNGVVFPVRTLGLFLFAIATVICGVAILKSNRQKEAARP